MESFASPNPYGFSGSYYGTPERYEMNRYAYRMANRQEEPEVAELKAPTREEVELQQAVEEEPVVYRRDGSYMRRSKFSFLFSILYFRCQVN